MIARFVIPALFLCLIISFPSFAAVGNNVPANIQIADSGDEPIPLLYASSMEEMLLFFDEADLIITATKQPQKLSDAPAIATIITSEDIRNMGARDIVDVLKKVPGFGVTKGFYGKEDIEVRGIKTANSDKVLFLIDSRPVNDLLSGGAVWVFDSMTVDNVKRIEVIRGPGSALYGNGAFSGVVNVVTKNGNDVDGVIATKGAGDFNTDKYNFQAGTRKGDLDVVFSFDYFETDGDELFIEKDAIGLSGYTKDFEQKYDTSLNLQFKDLSFNGRYVSRDRGAYLGASHVVTDETELEVDYYFGELIYNHDFESLTVTSKVYYSHFDWEAYWELFPEGFSFDPGTTPVFPDGVIGVPSAKVENMGLDLQLDYKIFNGNLLTVGGTRENRESYEVGHKANYNPLTIVDPLPSGNVEDVEYLTNWNQEKLRRIWAVYLQDVWDLTDRVNLTFGARHDHYSDVGNSTNPRVGLIWKFLESWDAKFLYGTAFRAPSFEELYNINNPVVLGNEDLDPEEMITYEVSLGHSYSERSGTRISYFYNSFRNKIQLVSQGAPGLFMFENSGGAKVWGIELEWKNEVTKELSTYLNYTYQKSKDNNTGEELADMASNKGNIGLNVSVGSYLTVNTNIFITGERHREAGDTRDKLPGYALADLTFLVKDNENAQLRMSVHNLFDKEYDDPSPLNSTPGDFPREGRQYMLEVTVNF